MIGIVNKDSSFFEVSSPDIDLDENDINRDLISLSITERMGSMPQGSLKMYDPYGVYSRILRTGARLDLAWGYKNQGAEIVSRPALSQDEISGNIERRGLSGFVSSPSGGGDDKGVITYSCNFTAYGFRGEDQTVTYDSGSRDNVVRSAMSELGIFVANQIVDFASGSESLSSDRSVRQDETTYLFLVRLAKEWRALFTISYRPNGDPVGIFVDPEKIGSVDAPARVQNLRGSAHEIGYLGEINNVKSYTWTSNESENGVGQNVQLELVDGQPVFRRYVAEEERAVSYRLNTDKISQAFKDKEVDGVVAQTKLVKELLAAKDFEQVKRFFDPYESTTAPQGFGYRIRLEMIGNPLYSPPNQVRLVNGFPDRLGSEQSIFYLNEVSHTIDRSGYNLSAEVVDVFAFSDLGRAVF